MWNQEIDNDTVLPSLIKSMPAFTVAISKCFRWFRGLVQLTYAWFLNYVINSYLGIIETFTCVILLKNLWLIKKWDFLFRTLQNSFFLLNYASLNLLIYYISVLSNILNRYLSRSKDAPGRGELSIAEFSLKRFPHGRLPPRELSLV